MPLNSVAGLCNPFVFFYGRTINDVNAYKKSLIKQFVLPGGKVELFLINMSPNESFEIV